MRRVMLVFLCVMWVVLSLVVMVVLIFFFD